MSADSKWGADVPISLPEPPSSKGLVAMGGWTFTEGGLAHDISEADRQAMVPHLSPQDGLDG